MLTYKCLGKFLYGYLMRNSSRHLEVPSKSTERTKSCHKKTINFLISAIKKKIKIRLEEDP